MISKHKYQTFIDLSGSEALSKGRFDEFLKEVLIVLAAELGVSRTSFWMYKEHKQAFENISLYESKEDNFIREKAIWDKDFPKGYRHLVTNHTIKINEVESDERLEELLDNYFIPNNINSIMSRQVWYNGELLGLLMLEQVAKYKEWGIAEEMHINIAVSYIIQAYNSKQWLAKYHPEKMSDGDLSDFVDKEKEEMRRKLTDHAFYTSHNIRHPITTILALIDLIKTNWEDRENYESFLAKLKIEIMNLDETIRIMSAKVELD